MSQNQTAPLIRFDHIVKSFGGTRALKDVSLDIHAGEILALLGENGAGKSTLIKSLAGIYALDSGEILYRGQTYTHRPAKFNVRQKVAFIHQDLGLIDWMSIAENMAMAIGYPKKGPLVDWKAADAQAARALAQIGCDLDPSTRVQDLTRTEKSLVAIARALAMRPQVMLFDEPTSALDPELVAEVLAVMRGVVADGLTMLVVTHELGFAREAADQVVFMDAGRIVEAGPPSQVLSCPTHPRTQGFIAAVLA